MRLETEIRLEDEIRKECKARFPSLDADWAVKRYMDNIYKNRKKTAKVLVGMLFEAIESQEHKKEST